MFMSSAIRRGAIGSPLLTCLAVCASLVFLSASAWSTQITGDPATDTGWTLAGHSLQNGTHVKGSANYGFDAYSTGFTVQAGSNVEISDGTYS